jgi:hypothetical protein
MKWWHVKFGLGALLIIGLIMGTVSTVYSFDWDEHLYTPANKWFCNIVLWILIPASIIVLAVALLIEMKAVREIAKKAIGKPE